MSDWDDSTKYRNPGYGLAMAAERALGVALRAGLLALWCLLGLAAASLPFVFAVLALKWMGVL